MLSNLEKKIIANIQGDIPISPRPYEDIAQNLQISESELIDALQVLCSKGVIRRFGATLRHQKSGYTANAMTAWQVDEDRADEVGEIMAAFRQVSHCYRRIATDEWPYNLYTMIHGTDETTVHIAAREISKATGVATYKVLFSRKELKKTSMVYFQEDPSS